MALIAAIGMDTYPENPNLIDFTIGYPLFQEEKREGIKLDTVAANNLGEAIDMWECRNAWRFAAGKVRVVLFGEEAARNGLQGFFDYLQLPVADDNASVVVVRGRSHEVLRAKLPETVRIAVHIETMLRTAYQEGHTIRSRMADLSTKAVVPGFDPVLPLLELQGENRIALVGAALFADTRMVGSISQNEAQLLLALYGMVPVDRLTIIIGESAELSKPAVEIELLKPKARLKPKLVDGEAQVGIDFKANYILRSYGSKVDLRKRETIDAVTRDIEATLYLEIQQLLAKLQAMQVDPLGVGKSLRAKNYRQVDPADLRQLWANATIDLQVKLRPFRAGAIHPTK